MDKIGKIGIYVDINNIEKGLESSVLYDMPLDYSRLFKQISEGYTLAVLNGYDSSVAMDSSVQATHDMLKRTGMNLKLYTPTKEHDALGNCVARQKEVDTAITVDVTLDLALRKVDVAVIVSGDRDMHPAVTRAEEEGFEVHVVALENTLKDKYRDSLRNLTLMEEYDAFLLVGENVERPASNVASFDVMKEVDVDA